VLGLDAYLLQTWHPATRPSSLDLDAEPRLQWRGLEVKRFGVTGKDSAVVEFVARYKVGGKAQRLHEVSRFERIDGRWVYVDGEFTASLP